MNMGPVISGRDVRIAVENTLKLWLPSTLAHVCRAAGLASDALKPPRDQSYHRMVSAEQLLNASEQLPAIVVATPDDTWDRDADGVYRSEWATLVSVATRGRNHDETADHNDLYRAAIRLTLAQHGSLGGFAAGVTVLGGSYEPIGEGDRTIMRGTVEATVVVDSALIDTTGPKEPPENPHAEPEEPVIETAHVAVEPIHPVWS